MATATKSETDEFEDIEFENIGPVPTLSLRIRRRGGVTVLKGRNGSGKTELIKAANQLVTHGTGANLRDGAKRGRVSGFGATMTVGASTRHSGQLEVESFDDSKFSLADIVNPKIEDPVAADRVRIKALVQIAGAEANEALFYELCGGQAAYEQLVTRRASETDDLPTLAARVKKALEAAARTQESDVERAEARAQAKRSISQGFDAKIERESAVLQAAHAAAVRDEERLKADAEAKEKAIKAATEATIQLEQAEELHDGPSVTTAASVLTSAKAALDRANKEVADLEAKLTAAKAEAKLADSQHTSAVQAHQAAEQHERTVASWRQSIEAGKVEPIDPELLTAARQRVEVATKAIEAGVTQRAAFEASEQVKTELATAAKHRKEAERLRDAAKATDGILSEVIASLGCPLYVKDERMMTKVQGEEEPFARLSNGQRWKVVVPIAVEAVKPENDDEPNGILVLPQDAWQDVDPDQQEEIHKMLDGTRVNILTAACTRGALRSEIFEPEATEPANGTKKAKARK